MKPKESDWKTFRAMVPDLRERYLKKKNIEIVANLTDKNLTPTEQFWNARKIIEEERKILENCLDGHTRSKLSVFMFLMYKNGMLSDDDLKNFSQGLRNNIKDLSNICLQ